MEAVLNTLLLGAAGRIGVAVSGGADSMALLIALHATARYELTVLHVNHGLRGAESDADEEFVCRFARELRIGVLVHRATLEGGNVEAAAREARYLWFRELLASGVVQRIATGHTASDQAETVLFRFLRGAGTAGLSGVRPSINGVVRPFLNVSREEVCGYLRAQGVPWREDSSNSDLKFARNRIRHKLLPLLTREWNPALPEVLRQTAEWARAEEEYWASEVPRLAGACVRWQRGAAILSVAGLAALALAARRRVVRFAICSIKGDLLGVNFLHVERVLELAAPDVGSGGLHIPGLRARRSFNWVRLGVEESAAVKYREDVRVPGAIRVPGCDTTLQLELKYVDSVYNIDGHQLDWGLLSGSLELRNWRPGDSYRQAGHAEIKLKHLFHRARIPLWERHGWPVITFRNSIIWARKFGPAAAFVRSAATDVVLVVREISMHYDEKANQNV